MCIYIDILYRVGFNHQFDSVITVFREQQKMKRMGMEEIAAAFADFGVSARDVSF